MNGRQTNIVHQEHIFQWLWQAVTRLRKEGVVSTGTALIPHGSVGNARRENTAKWTVEVKMKHLQRCFFDFLTTQARLMPVNRYEAQYGLNRGSIRKWRRRCLEEEWHLWDDQTRRTYTTAPQTIRDLHGLPRLGRCSENCYPKGVMDKAKAWVTGQITAGAVKDSETC